MHPLPHPPLPSSTATAATSNSSSRSNSTKDAASNTSQLLSLFTSLFTITKLLLFTTAPPRRRMLTVLLAPVLFLALLAPLLADKLDFDVDQVREPQLLPDDPSLTHSPR